VTRRVTDSERLNNIEELLGNIEELLSRLLRRLDQLEENQVKDLQNLMTLMKRNGSPGAD